MDDILNTIQPGQTLSEKDRVALAKANTEESEMAHRLAAEHRARDVATGGVEQPIIQSVADSVLDKLKALPSKESESK